MNMVNTTYKLSEEMTKKLQEFYENISIYYAKMNIKMDEDPFARNAQGMSKIHHEVLLLLTFLQTMPQVKNMNIKFYDLYYFVIKNRDDKEMVNKRNENNENE